MFIKSSDHNEDFFFYEKDENYNMVWKTWFVINYIKYIEKNIDLEFDTDFKKS